MSRVLPRKHGFEVEPTMVLRTRDPDDHTDFNKILPWFTPLFVWEHMGRDWVRWSVPKTVATRMGIDGSCECCGGRTVEGDADDLYADTAWHETSWWLEANGYSHPDTPPEVPTGSPTEKEEGSS